MSAGSAVGYPIGPGNNAILDNSNGTIYTLENGEWVSYQVDGLFGGVQPAATPYRGGYGLDGQEDADGNLLRDTYAGVYGQNVITRSGSNRMQQSFFGVLDDISAAIRAENREGLSEKLLPMIDKFMDNLLKVISTSGALEARYQGNVMRMKLNDIVMTEAHDELVGVELDKLTTEIMMAQAIYQASLGIMAYIVQPTLLNYLR